jgi:threonyl-tRNA synthetase
MDLFHLQEEAHGSVFWHPKGYRIWRELEAYMRRKMDGAGYREIKTPQLMDVRQWTQSGHWGKYAPRTCSPSPTSCPTWTRNRRGLPQGRR